jgi:predicted anti-sigma-YlaC factor YlaD
MTHDHLRCQAVVELLTDYLEGAVDASTSEELERHLVACEGCTSYVDQVRAAMTLTGTLRAQDVPAPLMDELLAMFRANC